jgi:hypothetical protein
VTPTTATRPAADEHDPYYASYVSLATESDALTALEAQLPEFRALLQGLTEAQGGHRYAPDKWSIKQVVGHVIDAERIFAYRALRIARGDRTPLPGFEEKDFAAAAGSDRVPLAALAEEFELLRRANLAMFRGFPDEAWLRRGTANQKEISVRALAYIIAGHGRHHARVLRERYLTTAGSTAR